jgi:hypothetical protein
LDKRRVGKSVSDGIKYGCEGNCIFSCEVLRSGSYLSASVFKRGRYDMVIGRKRAD